MVLLYFKYTGIPYKSKVLFKDIKHLAIVAVYWGIALIAKIIFVYVSNFMIPTNNVLNPDKTKNNENFGLIEAIIFFAA
jgi:hypothetical protein